MYYKGQNLSLKQYYYKIMEERNFEKSSETEWSIIADYGSSCEYTKEDIEFMNSIGYIPKDVINEDVWDEMSIRLTEIEAILENYESYPDENKEKLEQEKDYYLMLGV